MNTLNYTLRIAAMHVPGMAEIVDTGQRGGHCKIVGGANMQAYIDVIWGGR